MTKWNQVEVEPAQPEFIELKLRSNAAEIAALLLERRKLLFRGAVYGFLVAAIIALLIPNYYRASVKLMPPDDKAPLNVAMLSAIGGKGGDGLGMLAGDLLGGKSSVAVFTNVLRSRTVQTRIVDRFELRRVYPVPFYNGFYYERSMTAARTRLEDATDIADDRKSGIITVVTEARDPQLAADLASAYVTELNYVLNKVNTTAAHRERVFLEERLQTVRKELSQAQRQFSDFARKNKTLDIEEQGKVMLGAAARLQGELIAAESELSGLEQIYTGNNVRVRQARARVQELRRQLDKLGGDDGTGVGSEIYPSIGQLPEVAIGYADHFRNLKVQEAVFETLTRQYELAKVQEAKELATAKVLDPPEVPEFKAGPPRTTLALLGAFFGLLGACGLVILGERWKMLPEEHFLRRLWADAQREFRTRRSRFRWRPFRRSSQ